MTDVGIKTILKNKIVYAFVTSVQRTVTKLIEDLEDVESRDRFTRGLDAIQVNVESEDEHKNLVIGEENNADESATDERTDSESDEIAEEESLGSEEAYVSVGEERAPQKFDQKSLNDLFRKIIY